MVEVSDEIKSATEEAVKYIEAKEYSNTPKWYFNKYSSLPQYMKLAISASTAAAAGLFISFLYILYS